MKGRYTFFEVKVSRHERPQDVTELLNDTKYTTNHDKEQIACDTLKA